MRYGRQSIAGEMIPLHDFRLKPEATSTIYDREGTHA